MPAPLPEGHPPVASDRIGVLLLNLGTPDGTDYWPVRRYLSRVPLRSAGDRDQPADLAADPPGRRPLDAAAEERRQLRTHLGPRGERQSAAGDHAAPDREAAGSGWATTCSSISPCATAIRRPPRGSRRCRRRDARRILLVPLYPQYSATTTATANDKAFEALGDDALAAGGAHGAGVLRRGLLHRGAGEEHRRRRRGARLRAGPDPDQLSRHAASSISSAATPTTASASRRRGWCARSWAGRRRS